MAKQQTADSRQQTASSKRQTADSKQQTANSKDTETLRTRSLKTASKKSPTEISAG